MASGRLAQEITTMTNGFAYAYNTYSNTTKKIGTLYQYAINNQISQKDMLKQLGQIYSNLSTYTRGFGALVSKFNKQIAPQIIAKSSEMTNDFIKLADAFDKEGNYKMASKIDEHLNNVAMKDDVEAFYIHNNMISKLAMNYNIEFADFSDKVGAKTIADEIDKKIAELVEGERGLSTRYCPDHNGVQTVRVSERVYQCPMDGKVYNYETGFTDYKGQNVPGGSVAAQTSTTADFGGVPMVMYDNRHSVLNKIH